jgi:hypothetical protein
LTYISDPTSLDYGSQGHIGPFKEGEIVIVCPESGAAFDLRSDVVGSIHEAFHVIRRR